jgi:hypothetical protein
MIIKSGVDEDGHKHRELPAIIKPTVSIVFEHDCPYEDISSAECGNE